MVDRELTDDFRDSVLSSMSYLLETLVEVLDRDKYLRVNETFNEMKNEFEAFRSMVRYK